MNASVPATSTVVKQSDLTARARIRDAALRRFAEEGIAEARLKDIAADAGVSIPLITHHFGTKEGLRVACDEHLSEVIRDTKTEGMGGEPKDAVTLLQETYSGTPLLAYFARTLADGSRHTDVLVGRIVEDALVYSRLGVEHGLIKDSPRLDEYIKVLTIWQLGTFVMNRHVARHFDIDLLSEDTESALRWSLLAGRLLSEGIITVDYDKLFDTPAARSRDPRPTESATADRPTEKRT